VRAIRQDSRGTLWVATDGGLCEYRPQSGNFNRYVHDPTDPVSLVENRVTAIYEDRGAVLWVGTYGGVNSWNVGTGFFSHYKNDGSSPNQVSGNLIQAFAESLEDRVLWISAYGDGLNRLDRKSGDSATGPVPTIPRAPRDRVRVPPIAAIVGPECSMRDSIASTLEPGSSLIFETIPRTLAA
jgi:ligand-binding sensor domain-containing protein